MITNAKGAPCRSTTERKPAVLWYVLVKLHENIINILHRDQKYVDQLAVRFENVFDRVENISNLRKDYTNYWLPRNIALNGL